MGPIDWVWATPPSDALRALADAFAAGHLPPDGSLLKRSRARSVWAAPRSCGGLLLKHYRVSGLEPWKALVQYGRGEREYRVMEAFCRLGIPTVRPLAFAERHDGARLREAWFVGRLVPQARSLAELMLDPAIDEARRMGYAEAAIGVVVALHEHPFLHRDLHAGNLLLTLDERLLVIDLHSVWHVWRLTRARRMANLAELLFSLREGLSLDAAPELLASYAVRRGEPVDLIVREGRAALTRFERDYVRGRSARCMRDSSEYVSERLVEGHVHRRREYELDALRRDLAAHERVFARREPVHGGGDDGERGGSGTLDVALGDTPRARASRVECGEDARFVKSYRDRGPLVALRAWLGLGRARVAWKAARRLQIEGVPTPEALALLERRDGSAVLVTRVVDGALSLRDQAGPQASPLPPEVRGPLAFSLGHVVGRLSRAGLRHADLSPKNLLVGQGTSRATRDLRTSPPPGLPDVQVIDLDGLRRGRPHDARALARMLGQLGDLGSWVTRADRRRFARGFAASAGRDLPAAAISSAERLLEARRARRATNALPRPVR